MKGRLSIVILTLISLIVFLAGGRIVFAGDRPAMMAVGAIFILSGIALLVIVIRLTNENDWLRKEIAKLKQPAPR